MKTLTYALAILMSFCLSGFGVVHAQGYVKFEGVDGEVTVDGYEGWSEFISVSQTIIASKATTGAVRRTRRLPEFQEISIVKSLDKASLKIADRALRGFPTETVEMEWLLNFGGTLKPYYRYELENVTVVEYRSKGLGESDLESEWDGRVTEEIALDFDKITVTYWEYDDNGNSQGAVEYSWRRE